MTRLRRSFPALLALVSLLAGCDSDPVGPVEDGHIAAVLTADEDFETLVQALDATPDVRAMLAGTTPYTLFAPTDDAFHYVGTSTQATLFDPDNRDLLQRILAYHVVPGVLTAEDLTDGAVLTSADGAALHVRHEGEVIYVDNAEVDVERLIEADNGVVFPISDVLRSNLDIASRLLLVPIARDFLDFAMRTGTLAALDPASEFTVLAPIDNAFQRLGTATVSLLERTSNADVLSRIIDFHVIPQRLDFATLESGTELLTREGASVLFTKEAGQFFIDGLRVVADPAQTSNGAIYLLGDVLLGDLNLDERLRISPTLTTFEFEVRQRPDLAARLQGTDDYTVFAFVNTGLDLLSQATRDALNLPENAALEDRLIRYHVVPGRHPSESLQHGDELVSIDGLTLPVRRDGAELFIGDRPVLEPDIATANGLLYRMAYAMLPPSDVVDTMLLRGFTLHVQAIRDHGLEALFRQEGPFSVFAVPDSLYIGDPSLLTRPDLRELILYHAAGERLSPLTHNDTFDPLHGPRRTIVYAPHLGTFLLDGSAEVGLFTHQVTNGELYYVVTNIVAPPE